MEIFLPLILLTQASCLAVQTPLEPSTPFPFTKIVVFGDDHSDDGSGSFAHNLTHSPNLHLWGFNTWTDGSIAATHLAQSLHLPLSSYAFGGSSPGTALGSVCNTSALPLHLQLHHAHLPSTSSSPSIVPDISAQLNTYNPPSSSSSSHEIRDTLHILWTGANDILGSPSYPSEGRFALCGSSSANKTLCRSSQATFTSALSNCILNGVITLLRSGARYILVPSLLPREITPWTRMWISQEPSVLEEYANVIDNINTQIRQSIALVNKEYFTSVVYHDTTSFLRRAATNPALSGVDTSRGGDGFAWTCVDGCPGRAAGWLRRREKFFAALNSNNSDDQENSNEDENEEKDEVEIETNWAMYWAKTGSLRGEGTDEFFWMTEAGLSATVHRALAKEWAGALRDAGY